MIDIILVEDSVAVRNRLRLLLAEIPQFRVMGEYDSADAAIAAIASQPPDVLLLDIKLRVGNGIDVLRYVTSHAQPVQVIVFSQHDDAEYREQFQQAGARFFFNKTHETANLRNTLQRTAAQS